MEVHSGIIYSWLEHGPFEDVFPIKNCDFSLLYLLYVSLTEGKYNTQEVQVDQTAQARRIGNPCDQPRIGHVDFQGKM